MSATTPTISSAGVCSCHLAEFHLEVLAERVFLFEELPDEGLIDDDGVGAVEPFVGPEDATLQAAESAGC